MSYEDVKIADINFKPFTDHNPGKSIATETPVIFCTPWLRVTSYPRTYVALRDQSGNDIERVNVFCEIQDTKFLNWCNNLQQRAREELIEQKVDPNPESHWNPLLVHDKYLRSKLHVRPSKVLQLDAYEEDSETPFNIELSKVSNHFYTDVQLRFMLEIRPILHKNGRSGITFRVVEVEFKKKQRRRLK